MVMSQLMNHDRLEERLPQPKDDWPHLGSSSAVLRVGSNNRICGILRNLCLSIALLATPALGDVEGPVTHVRDADTIEVSGVPVRLNGINAPERGHHGWSEGRVWMESVTRGQVVLCDLNGERTHDRWVGVCYVDGVDLGAAAVAAGWALDCARFSGGRYAHLETPEARANFERARFC